MAAALQAIRCFTFPTTPSAHQVHGTSSASMFHENGRRTRTRRSLHIRAAKPETVEKVSHIVRIQLALSPDVALTPESKFTELGADSLDTVEIVMRLEDDFNINVEEQSSDNITTIQEAADLIDMLVEQKS
ncbi:acyl carrier protein [Genlisea aurea]|uniref:Acyl carrier protein n=1 Tax=Genlisea aurea TaxID=192259 RepID=S8D114_9LAMI|nr:acyl carrier protein [Genlisea aurea]